MNENKQNISDEVDMSEVTIIDRESASTEGRVLPKWLDYVGQVLLLVTAAYHLIAAGYKPLSGIQHTAVHLGLGVAVIMLYFPWSKKFKDNKILMTIDVILAGLSIFNMFYVSSQYATLEKRVGLPSPTYEVILGVIVLVMLFIAAYRTMGPAFPIIAGVFVLYMFIGPKLPGALFHSGITLNRFVSKFYLTMNGIYGSITKTSADVIILFIMFSSIIKNSPIGDFIMDVATSLFGQFRGGPAKVACASSGLMGMLSGSAVANVAGTGAITIPMMKKAGYPAAFAGAVEADASTCGQVMPPVMGGSIFILVELVGISYNHVLLIAAPIAILYYIGLMMSIDLKAIRMDLHGLAPEDKPSLSKTLAHGWYLSAPIVVLIAMLAMGYTAHRSGFYAIIVAVIVSFISPRDRMTPKILLKALMDGVKDAAVIFAVVGLASLIQGIVTVSGIGLRLSGILVALASGKVLLLLVLTAVASIVLGMGLPVIVCYTFLALLIAPGMVDLGVPIVAAHLFIFYYGVLSNITPPVALASLVASGIAKSKPMETAIEACKLAFPIFFIPFFFIYSPAVLLQDGLTAATLWAYLTVLLGLYAAAAGFTGAILPKIKIDSMVIRVLLVAAGVLMLVPLGRTDVIGIAVLVVLQLALLIRSKASVAHAEVVS